MPTLDVTRVLANPRFADSITVTRTTTTVDPNTGRPIETKTSQDLSAVVTSDRGRNLQRNPDAALSEGSIIIHSTFTFTEGGQVGAVTYDADVVTWQGRDWTVVTVDDYSRYGAGFTCATCRLLTLR
jgi:hypothetical protein